MVKIRLMRVGKRKQPSYRIVVEDSRTKQGLGHYNPLSEPAEVTVDTEAALAWLRRGAQPSDAARRLLAQGVLQGWKRRPIRRGDPRRKGDAR